MLQPKTAKIISAVLVALSIGVLMVVGFTITASGQTEKPPPMKVTMTYKKQ